MFTVKYNFKQAYFGILGESVCLLESTVMFCLFSDIFRGAYDVL
jgi:hypothetical protein